MNIVFFVLAETGYFLVRLTTDPHWPNNRVKPGTNENRLMTARVRFDIIRGPIFMVLKLRLNAV